jgi:[ribosomal protein S5]-alanine N-acetyltransferase
MSELHPLEIPAGPLFLRHLALTDTHTIFMLSQEPGMKEWLPDQVYEDEAQARDVLCYLIAQYASPADPRQSSYVLGVCLSATRELIGHVGFSPCALGVEVGYAIGDAHQRRGYAKQAVSTATSWSLAAFGLDAVHGLVAEENGPSCRVLEACGFQRVDLQRRKLHGVERMVRICRFTV